MFPPPPPPRAPPPCSRQQYHNDMLNWARFIACRLRSARINTRTYLGGVREPPLLGGAWRPLADAPAAASRRWLRPGRRTAPLLLLLLHVHISDEGQGIERVSRLRPNQHLQRKHLTLTIHAGRLLMPPRPRPRPTAGAAGACCSGACPGGGKASGGVCRVKWGWKWSACTTSQLHIHGKEPTANAPAAVRRSCRARASSSSFTRMYFSSSRRRSASCFRASRCWQYSM